MSHGLPETARRLFAHYDEHQILSQAVPGLVFSRLLEEGDSIDLTWLTQTYSEEQIMEWLDRYGSRQLTRRSRSFWQSVLDRAEPSQPVTADRLWPL